MDVKNLRIVALSRDGHSEVVDFCVESLLLFGWSGRNTEEVMKHIEELEKIGVPKPESTPEVYPVSTYLVESYKEVEVQHPFTSGEVEYVLFVDGGEIKYVTVGSDHTDRDLEKVSIAKSKQAYPNIIPPVAWYYEEVADHWDELVLRSWVKCEGEELLYQSSSLEVLIAPEDLLKIVEELGVEKRNLVIFSGTISTISSEIIFGESFRMEMEDPVLDRRISYTYGIKPVLK